jgi:hypothetical protein
MLAPVDGTERRHQRRAGFRIGGHRPQDATAQGDPFGKNFDSVAQARC